MARRPVIELSTLQGGEHIQATLWQEVTEGVAEPALLIRTYCDGLIGVQQAEKEILINRETVALLCKTLRNFSQIS